MSSPTIEVTLSELTDRINSMTDAQLIDYSKLHISLDSGVLIECLVSRLRSCKRELFMCATNQVDKDDHQ